MIFLIGIIYLLPLAIGVTIGLTNGTKLATQGVSTGSMFWRGVLTSLAAIFMSAACVVLLFFWSQHDTWWGLISHTLVMFVYMGVLCVAIYAVVFWIGRKAANVL